MLTKEDLTMLSASMEDLRSLVLSVHLPDGSGGLPGFKELQQLVLKPQKSRRLAVDGTNMRAAASSGAMKLRARELPPKLMDFQADDIFFAAATASDQDENR